MADMMKCTNVVDVKLFNVCVYITILVTEPT